MNIATAHAHSRDWLEIFYDSNFSPPQLFLFVLQWIVCSSVHMVPFLTRLSRLAEENGFLLVRIPIGQLLPQPAPLWVLSGDRETSFDRLAFYSPEKIPLPRELQGANRARLHAQLLESWIGPPLNFIVLLSTPVEDFKVEAPGFPDQSQQLMQRLRGWVLCDKDALCLIALREDTIQWFENKLQYSESCDARASEQRTHHVDGIWRAFRAVTERILSVATCA